MLWDSRLWLATIYTLHFRERLADIVTHFRLVDAKHQSVEYSRYVVSINFVAPLSLKVTLHLMDHDSVHAHSFIKEAAWLKGLFLALLLTNSNRLACASPLPMLHLLLDLALLQYYSNFKSKLLDDLQIDTLFKLLATAFLHDILVSS